MAIESYDQLITELAKSKDYYAVALNQIVHYNSGVLNKSKNWSARLLQKSSVLYSKF